MTAHFRHISRSHFPPRGCERRSTTISILVVHSRLNRGEITAVCSVVKMGRLNLRPRKDLPLTDSTPYSRARTRPIRIDFPLVVVYHRRGFGRSLRSPESSRGKERGIHREDGESTIDKKETSREGSFTLRFSETRSRKNLRRNQRGGGGIDSLQEQDYSVGMYFTSAVNKSELRTREAQEK